ncbi:ammonium transporter, Amt family [Butyrivibrio fibrisolvens DSM 3071]|uniref:Ammonium transporter, Amt family n=1 Tax=Butyrivibrio fibrisolvens DSM 3071 TaxID=1121131 RepID=A0A1M6FDK6_BUTFI|nr:ammonium transporter [Butyrivibrio fibrisolvens]SHI95820.1 ammonium transporter, Amt family [Butyrivibrio fibrisolvens DSM 3071]
MSEEILSYVNSQIFGVWFLAGAALVFWMQAGFAMVETGFTRAKNAGNIIMKNLMDFCIGTVMFILIGFGLFLGEDALFGLVGLPNFDIFSHYADFDWSGFVFNLVFCATTATIVSGAMAERTRFISYCVYSAVISGVIYPVEAHWTWGGGWLAQMGFHDFAGSNCIHMVGGICALIGAWMLGPRIGKFTKDANGKITKVNAFPGHNIPIGALGVFILWLGWYGFNGAAATSLEQLGDIFVTTTIAPAVATVVCMIFTWIKYGKPDVSMCLNASLAGLVAITAPCDTVDAFGSIVIGVVAGLLVVFGVWLLDNVLRIDDPVGAVAVHMMNGIWGTIAVGLFSTNSVPGYSVADANGNEMVGLFYGGGFKLLGIQFIGMFATIAWTVVTIIITFAVIKATLGLRASEEEELSGLDVTEHGLSSAYAGFSIMDITGMEMEENENTDLGIGEYDKASEALKNASVKVIKAPTYPEADSGIHKVVIIAKLSRYDKLRKAMNDLGVTGMTVTQVMGCGIQKGAGERYRGVEMDATLLPKVKLEIVVAKIPVDKVIETAKRALYTGHIGDGKIFVYNVGKVVKIRTGEEDIEALADVE